MVLSYREPKAKFLGEAKVWRIASMPSSYSWRKISPKRWQKAVVGQLLQVVGRPPQMVSQDNKWSAMVGDDQHTENKPMVGLSTRKDDSKT